MTIISACLCVYIELILSHVDFSVMPFMYMCESKHKKLLSLNSDPHKGKSLAASDQSLSCSGSRSAAGGSEREAELHERHDKGALQMEN